MVRCAGVDRGGIFRVFHLFPEGIRETEPHVLDALPLETARAPFRVLVPVANPNTIASLLDISIPVVKAKDGDLIVSTTVEVPIQLPIQEGMKYINHRMPLLRAAQAHAKKQNLRVVSDIRVAHRLDEGILSAVSDEHVDLLVIGWKGFTTTRERIFGEVLDRVVTAPPPTWWLPSYRSRPASIEYSCRPPEDPYAVRR